MSKPLILELNEKIKGTVLYETTDNKFLSEINLEDIASNYKLFVVEAKNKDENAILIIPPIIEPEGKKFPMITINTGNYGTKTYIGNSVWKIEGNKINCVQSNWLSALNKDGVTELSEYSNCYISKVIGY